MRVISTTDISRSGTDCHIYEKVSLVTQYGAWAVISCLMITAHKQHVPERKEIRVLCSTSSKTDAVKNYKSVGGVLHESDI